MQATVTVVESLDEPPAAEPTATPTTEPTPTTPPTEEPPPAPEPVKITSEIRSFKLENLTIQTGTEVTWVQRDSTTHTATSGQPVQPDGIWDTGFLGQDESSSPVLFETAGTFPYHCTVHGASMTATVTVVEGTATPSTVSTSPYG